MSYKLKFSQKLDAEEQELLASVDAGEWHSKGLINERIIELQAYLKQEKKKKFLLLVHQYTNNKINLEM